MQSSENVFAPSNTSNTRYDFPRKCNKSAIKQSSKSCCIVLLMTDVFFRGWCEELAHKVKRHTM